MFVAIDVGNTNTNVGLYSEGKWQKEWRLSTDRDKTIDEYALMLRQMFMLDNYDFKAVDAVGISSVVPPLTSLWERMFKRYLMIDPLVIGSGTKTGMEISYDTPRDVGADRIVGAVAAYRKYGGPCIIADFGTATTFDAVSAGGQYLGGAIMPGVRISVEALSSRTAKLPWIEMQRPAGVIGKNTVWAMQSGIVNGYTGAVEHIVSKMKEELGGRATVVATGGFGTFIAEGTQTIDHVDPMLVIEGIRIVWEMNQRQ
jgi:type III pantothenate kinase